MVRLGRKTPKSGSSAEVVDLGVSIDVGAPLPHMVSDGQAGTYQGQGRPRANTRSQITSGFTRF